jgi:predicted nuclease with TOPRIM domain
MATIKDIIDANSKLGELYIERDSLTERFARLTADATKAESRLQAIEAEIDALLDDLASKADDVIRGRRRP